MSWRTVVINFRCRLDVKLGYMICRGEKEYRIHLSEIAVVIVEGTAVSMTVALINRNTNEIVKKSIKLFTIKRSNY